MSRSRLVFMTLVIVGIFAWITVFAVFSANQSEQTTILPTQAQLVAGATSIPVDSSITAIPTDNPPYVAVSNVAENPLVSLPTPQIEAITIDQLPQQVPNRQVIRFTSDTTQAEREAYIALIPGAVIEQTLTPLDTVVVTLPEGESLPDSSQVVYSEPDYYAYALLALPPNDPFYNFQWALPVVGIPDYWGEYPDNPTQINVAVIDTGICAEHVEFTGRLLTGYDYVDDDSDPDDENGHGCMVTGVIAANMNDGYGVAGVAPNAQILPLRVLDEEGGGLYSDIAAAIIYATDQGVSVINLSLGGASPSSTLKYAIDYAVDRGVTLVAASGNEGIQGVLYPAAYSEVIAVGSVDDDLEMSDFTNYGPELNTLAPGRSIYTTAISGGYNVASGTSLAAPYVTGMVVISQTLNRDLIIDGGLIGIEAAEPDVVALADPPDCQVVDMGIEIGSVTDLDYAGIFDADGNRMVISSTQDLTGQNADGSMEVFLWDEQTGLQQITDFGDNYAIATSISDDGSRILIFERGYTDPEKTTVWLWDEQTGMQILYDVDEIGDSGGMLSGDGQRTIFTRTQEVVIIEDYPSLYRELAIWDSSSQSIQTVDLESLDINYLGFLNAPNYDGTKFLVTAEDTTIIGFVPYLYYWEEGEGFTQVAENLGTWDTFMISGDGNRVFYEVDDQAWMWLPATNAYTALPTSVNPYVLSSTNYTGTRFPYFSTSQVTSYEPDGTSEIYIWDESNGVFPITDYATGGAFYPSISDNGNHIAFAYSEDPTDDDAPAFLQVAICEDAPLIVEQPQEQTIEYNGDLTLSINVGGPGTINYQWYEGLQGDTSTPVGTNSSTLSLSNLTSDTSYWVRVSNEYGSTDRIVANVDVLLEDFDLFCLTVTDVPASECEALISLYNSTDGDNWINKAGWLSDTTVDNWYGVTVNNGHVTELVLQDNDLSAGLPPEINQLANLEILWLINAELSDLPPEIGQLTQLTNLAVPNNQLIELPPEIGQLTNLEYLGLWENQLSALPPEIGQLSNLKELALSDNQLVELPPEIGQLVNLQQLMLYQNNLVELPPEIGQLENLQFLDLIRNDLSELPPEIGQLENLRYLDLEGNNLTSLPPEIGQLSNLIALEVNHNDLVSLPAEIGQLSNLEQLFVSYNNLTALPPEIGQLTSLENFHVVKNQLHGAIPQEIGQLPEIKILLLNGNYLTGEVPANLTNRNFTTLNLGYNALYASGATADFLDIKDPDWKDTQTIAPTDLAVVSYTNNSISLDWTPILYTDDGGYYEISYGIGNGDFMVAGTTADKVTTGFTINNLQQGIEYEIRIRTFTPSHENNQNDLWSEYSEVITFTIPFEPLTPPDSLVEQDTDRSRAEFSWNDTMEGDTDVMIVERSIEPDPNNWVEIIRLPAYMESFTDETVICGNTYHYRLRAYRIEDGSYSPYSSTLTVETDDCPTPVTNIVGLYKNGVWQFRDSNSTGPADVRFRFGPQESGWHPLVGDWNRNGDDSIAVYKDGMVIMRMVSDADIADTRFYFGPREIGWTPIVGDWNGDGIDSLGVYKEGIFVLSDYNDDRPPQYRFVFGPQESGYIPISGDWNGSGSDTVGLYKDGTFYLTNRLRDGVLSGGFTFGPQSGWYPLIGDWNKDGISTIGVFDAGVWRLRNTNGRGVPEIGFNFGSQADAGWIPLSSYRGEADVLMLLADGADQLVDVPTETAIPVETVEVSTTPEPETTESVEVTEEVTDVVEPEITVEPEPVTLEPTITETPEPTPILVPSPTETLLPSATPTAIPTTVEQTEPETEETSEPQP